ncbi:translation initiation factor eIF 4e-like domain-containing protein [Cokeromyces recurvatus]|uniref:translation initiation factor eIF 4e-like domain-containing protein n=1 Tax=Cokeromyces recurvatus TaxID=90255 RepID=UPI002220202C|nr:translation initiation factor eIF 4e-like domain-containing protein [Cokeromyces recurvatus]KAI7905170.1 translation initiation factor eIF 4e-like domain-containing protein [Cokeromyces recurvatus]
MATTLSPEVVQLASTMDYSVKHPLQNTWTFWFDNPGKKANVQSWADNLKEIVSFDTVEDFWSTMNNVAKVNHLALNSNYHLFKQGVRPEWEDEANAEGGKFSIQFPKNKAGDAINEYWTYLLLAVIGEQLATEEEICGAVISVRKTFYRIALWIKTSNDSEKIEKISEQLRETLNLSEDIPIEFHIHNDASAKAAAALAAASLEDKKEDNATTTEGEEVASAPVATEAVKTEA